MATAKYRAVIAGEQEELKMDMSPMIDMVFLLLIFFMVTSTFIRIRNDRNVEVPVARSAEPLALAEGRIVINIYEDGTLKDVDGNTLNMEGVESLVRRRFVENKAQGLETKLHIRGDRRAIVREMKRVVTAAARAGVMNVVFATYKVDKYK